MREDFVARTVYGLGSILMLGGAFALGGVLHAVFVEGSLALASPLALGGVLLGVLLVGVGRRLEERHRETLTADEDDEREDADEGAPDDAPERGMGRPVDESDLEKYERDDAYDR